MLNQYLGVFHFDFANVGVRHSFSSLHSRTTQIYSNFFVFTRNKIKLFVALKKKIISSSSFLLEIKKTLCTQQSTLHNFNLIQSFLALAKNVLNPIFRFIRFLMKRIYLLTYSCPIVNVNRTVVLLERLRIINSLVITAIHEPWGGTYRLPLPIKNNKLL